MLYGNYFSKALAVLATSFVFTISQFNHAIALEQDEISPIARKFTVRIDSEIEGGSGVIITSEPNSNVYTVLTNSHVVDAPNDYYVTTHDNKQYKVIKASILSVQGVDLAVFQFKSEQNYPIVEISSSEKLKSGSTIYTLGWSSKSEELPSRTEFYTIANIVNRVSDPEQGYEILHDLPSVQGTSGAPVLDKNARLIGINGKSFCQGHPCYGLAIPIQIYLENKDKRLPILEVTVPEDFISLGEEEARKGNYRNAIAEYNKALKQEPENLLDIYYLRGEAFFALRDYDAAIEDFSQFVRLSPKNYLAYFYRGFIRAENNDFSGAIADYNQAIEINPNFSLAYTNRGLAASRLGNTQSALEDYNRAISINPESATAYYNRGLVLGRDLEKFQEALADFDKAIELNPEEAEAYLNRGNVYNALQEWQPAIDNYSEAIKLNSKLADAHYNRGLSYFEVGEIEKALTDFQSASTIYQSQEDNANYQRALDRIREISGN